MSNINFVQYDAEYRDAMIAINRESNLIMLDIVTESSGIGEKIKNFAATIITKIRNLITGAINKIKTLFGAAQGKKAVEAFDNALKEDPSLANEKFEVPDIRAYNKCMDEWGEEIKRSKDIEETNKKFSAKAKAILGTVITVTGGALSLFVKKEYDGMIKDYNSEYKDCEKYIKELTTGVENYRDRIDHIVNGKYINKYTKIDKNTEATNMMDKAKSGYTQLMNKQKAAVTKTQETIKGRNFFMRTVLSLLFNARAEKDTKNIKSEAITGKKNAHNYKKEYNKNVRKETDPYGNDNWTGLTRNKN